MYSRQPLDISVGTGAFASPEREGKRLVIFSTYCKRLDFRLIVVTSALKVAVLRAGKDDRKSVY